MALVGFIASATSGEMSQTGRLSDLGICHICIPHSGQPQSNQCLAKASPYCQLRAQKESNRASGKWAEDRSDRQNPPRAHCSCFHMFWVTRSLKTALLGTFELLLTWSTSWGKETTTFPRHPTLTKSTSGFEEDNLRHIT